MKVQRVEETCVSISDLIPGEVFEFEGDVFMITDENSGNEDLKGAVSFEGGIVHAFDITDQVIQLPDAIVHPHG